MVPLLDNAILQILTSNEWYVFYDLEIKKIMFENIGENVLLL